MKTNNMYNYQLLEELAIADVISANEMLDLFVNWHGLESLTEDFIEFVKDELEN